MTSPGFRRVDFELPCHLCGQRLINHAAYIDEVPDDAVEGKFDLNVRGFYCLTTGTTTTNE